MLLLWTFFFYKNAFPKPKVGNQGDPLPERWRHQEDCDDRIAENPPSSERWDGGEG